MDRGHALVGIHASQVHEKIYPAEGRDGLLHATRYLLVVSQIGLHELNALA